MVLVKKIVAVVAVLAVGLVAFGYLPKPVAQRLTRAMLLVMIVGFAVRLFSYLMASP